MGRGQLWQAHSAGCFFVMCDGSVQSITYTVDAGLTTLYPIVAITRPCNSRSSPERGLSREFFAGP